MDKAEGENIDLLIYKKEKRYWLSESCSFLGKDNLIDFFTPTSPHYNNWHGRLKGHIQSKQEGIKYPCNDCDYQAPYQSHLQKHIKKVSSILVMIVIIKLHIGVIFRNIFSLNRKVSSIYPCNDCDYQASYQSQLQKHIKYKHVGKVSQLSHWLLLCQ